MVTLSKPMKAPSVGATIEQFAQMFKKGPVACSPKYDGIRAEILDTGVMSSTLKPIGNNFIQRSIGRDFDLLGLEGELIVGLPYQDMNDPNDDVFNRTTGAVRRSDGEPDFHLYVFDDFTNKGKSYVQRWIDTFDWNEPLDNVLGNERIIVTPQEIYEHLDDALEYESRLIAMGYEGMMGRTLCGIYKEGRLSFKDCNILKRKPLEQDECIIVGMYEQMENQNEQVLNALGGHTRSSHKDNKVGKGTLGGFICKSKRWKDTFRCGTIKGGTKEWRQMIYDNPEMAMNMIMTYKYQGIGSLEKPRQPIGKAEFRLPIDITDY